MTIFDTEPTLGTPIDLRDEPPQVRSALSALGRLLGAALAEPPRDLASFVAEHLRLDSADAAVVSVPLLGLDGPLVRVAVARLLDGVPGLVVADDTGTRPPEYELVTVDVGEDVAAPDDLAAYLPAGTVFEFPAVLVVTCPARIREIALHVRRADRDRARGELTALLERARTVENFYRGKTLSAVAGEWGLQLTPVRPVMALRSDVVHPAAVWAEIDANIGGLTRHADALRVAGLGAARGILVAGPPGVGKTALCRVIATELPAGTTIVLVQPNVSPGALASLYESLEGLAPAAVFLDDIDLIAGTRRTGSGGPVLGEFLTRLDGFRPPVPVVTVATTNVTESLDPALLRPGRFDAVIEIGPPDRAARAAILRGYLAPIAADVPVEAVAAATDGATGADLREIVRRTVLERGAELTVADLLEVVRAGRWRPTAPTGQYL